MLQVNARIRKKFQGNLGIFPKQAGIFWYTIWHHENHSIPGSRHTARSPLRQRGCRRRGKRHQRPRQGVSHRLARHPRGTGRKGRSGDRHALPRPAGRTERAGPPDGAPPGAGRNHIKILPHRQLRRRSGRKRLHPRTGRGPPRRRDQDVHRRRPEGVGRLGTPAHGLRPRTPAPSEPSTSRRAAAARTATKASWASRTDASTRSFRRFPPE